jgi:hypothetical protein
MNTEVVNRRILELTVEDMYGLWEVVWGLRNLLPDRTDLELRDLAKSSIIGLLRKSWIALYSRIGAAGEERPVPGDQVESLLSVEDDWREPSSNSLQILVGATEEGIREYYQGRARARS